MAAAERCQRKRPEWPSKPRARRVERQQCRRRTVRGAEGQRRSLCRGRVSHNHSKQFSNERSSTEPETQFMHQLKGGREEGSTEIQMPIEARQSSEAAMSCAWVNGPGWLSWM